MKRSLIILVISLTIYATLATPAVAEPWIEITTDRAPVTSGNATIGTVRKGQVYEATDTSGEWYGIEIDTAQGKQAGWIAGRNVRITTAPVIPKPPAYLQVVAESATVRLGEEVRGTVRRGQVLSIVKGESPWFYVRFTSDEKEIEGYVHESEAQIVDESVAGPGSTGRVAYSFAAAQVRLDENREQITLTAGVARRDSQAKLSLWMPDETSAALSPLKLEQVDDQVTLTGTIEQLLASLTPGTRSLWLVEGSGEPRAAHRLDLPAVQLGTAVQTQQFAEFTEGLVLMLPATGLLPGFVVEAATPDAALRPVPRVAGGLPRYLDVYSDGRQEFVRVAVPFNDNRALQFRVRNADGSRSAAVEVTRRGTRVDRAARITAVEIPARVDGTVAVPAVELLAVSDAVGQVRSAGLAPRAIDASTLQPREFPASGIVVRQIVGSAERLPAGADLMLVVEADTETGLEWTAGEAVRAGTVRRGYWGDLSDVPPENFGVIDAADALNLADIVAAPAGDPAASEFADDEPAIDDSGLSGEITGGGLIGYDAAANDQSELFAAGGAEMSNTTDRRAVLKLGVEPGVNLDPSATTGRKQAAAMLKLVLQALLNQPSSQQLPGPVGTAIGGAVKNHEDDLLDGLAAGGKEWTDNRTAPEVLDFVTGTLKVALSVNEQTQALDEWRKYAALRPHPALIDVNRNGRVADDTAIWFIHWLFDRGKFDPTTIATLTTGGGGNPIAVIPPSVQPPGGGGLIDPPNTTPNNPILPIVPPSIVPPGSSGGQPPLEPPPPPIPQGEAVVTLHSTPDSVRTPPVEGELVSTAHQRLTALGLKIANRDELFASDKVVASRPQAGVWVDSGSSVALTVLRKVPDVVRLSLEGADARLAQYKLQSSTEGKTAPNDIVTKQSPVAGTMISPQQPVELTLSVLVPHVVGMKQEAAATTLTEGDLAWKADSEKVFLADQVAAQSPPAGSIAERGDEVTLTLHLPVPSVTGISLADARDSLADWDLVADVPNDLAHMEDIVRGQLPRAGTYVPHRSTAKLDPVKGIVPNLRGKSFGEAVALLRNVEDYQAAMIGDLIDGDIITGQNPAAGSEYERGQTVTLDARVSVPNVARRNIGQARNTIAQADGNLNPVIDGNAANSDVVYSQSPRGGELAYPRSDVILVPGVFVPNLRGLSPNQVDGELRAVNLNGRIVSSSTTETVNRAEVGRVVIAGQNPGAGLYRRSDVDLVRLEATEFVLAMRTVPDVDGNTVSAAMHRIRQADLNVLIDIEGRVYTPNEYNALPVEYKTYSNQGNIVENIVGRPTPSAGTRLVAGQTVTIHVVVFK